MVTSVSDARSNANDQIAHAVRALGRSRNRTEVFRAIYAGKQRVKTVSTIAASTGLSRKQVLEQGLALANNHVVTQTQRQGETAYEKDPFYSQHKSRILTLTANPAKLADLPTKTSPRSTGYSISVRALRSMARVRRQTVDDFSSFSRVKDTRLRSYAPIPLDESSFKRGLQAILGEVGSFKDWGGERNDLWTTRIVYRGRRRGAAFAFKGKGTKGRLTPGKMGKNGDQIQRLFQSPADVFFVQHWREIDQSVIELMHTLAVAKSVMENREIVFCVIDGKDSQRLIAAYPGKFS